ncbi:MAG TPA: hypothetical protein VNU47_01250 [Candidatus Paceibacterota bacterium]|nr:hypothetical protein [Candidatus Paceibacterota bacterium]
MPEGTSTEPTLRQEYDHLCNTSNLIKANAPLRCFLGRLVDSHERLERRINEIDGRTTGQIRVGAAVAPPPASTSVPVTD